MGMQTIFDDHSQASLLSHRQPRFKNKSAKVALPLSTGPIRQGPKPDRRQQTQCFTSKEFQLSSVMMGKNKKKRMEKGRKKSSKTQEGVTQAEIWSERVQPARLICTSNVRRVCLSALASMHDEAGAALTARPHCYSSKWRYWSRRFRYLHRRCGERLKPA